MIFTGLLQGLEKRFLNNHLISKRMLQSKSNISKATIRNEMK